MEFVTARGSVYSFDSKNNTTVRNRKNEDGSSNKQHKSTLTVFISEEVYGDIKKRWGNEIVDIQYTTSPEIHLLPLEIWYSVKRHRNMLFIKENKLRLYHTKTWFNGTDFHIGNKIIEISDKI